MSAAGLVAGPPAQSNHAGIIRDDGGRHIAAVAGPVVHHHFAELLPWHSHQFTSEKTLTEHSHIYGAHVHSEGQILDGTVSLVSEEGGIYSDFRFGWSSPFSCLCQGSFQRVLYRFLNG